MVKKLIKGAAVETQDNTTNAAVGVYFDIIQEHSLSLQSQITDNWMENNSVINDHIANQPIIISLRGISGELVYEPSETSGIVAQIRDFTKNKLGTNAVNKLSAITSLVPPVDNMTQLAKNAVSYTEASYKRYKKIVQRFTSAGRRQERLRKIYQDLNTLRETKTALYVQTPYSSFSDMYIQSLTLRQNELSYITDIEISLKQLYFLDSLTTSANEQTREKVNFLQRDEVENHGKTQGNTMGSEDGFGGDGNYLFKLSASYNG